MVSGTAKRAIRADLKTPTMLEGLSINIGARNHEQECRYNRRAAMLSKIQSELHAPKGQWNKFGKYNYRSCEDILGAVKPVLEKHGGFITVTDELVLIGDRYYVKATATYHGEQPVSVSAYAREPEDKKGMDASQITGTASSYARKYALNGLLLIDDAKDADSNEHREHIDQAPVEYISQHQVADLDALIEEVGANKAAFLKHCKITSLDKLPYLKYAKAVSDLEEKRARKERAA